MLVTRALAAGLSALALTDHDSLQGLPEFEAAAAGSGLITVAGAELSAACDGDDDVHVLGLFIDPAEPELAVRLETIRRERETRGEAMAARLASYGIRLDIQEIKKTVAGGAFGRPHIARAMVEEGYVGSLDEAFERFLTKGKPGYVKKPKWAMEDAIQAIHKAGGIAVLAHPIWYGDPERVIRYGTTCGLDGVEVFHTDHDQMKENEFGGMAEKAGLLKSAGSDYHGPPDGRKKVGDCRLEDELWERLVAAARRRRDEAGRPPIHLTPR